jgi:hypothetical protein
MPDPSPTLLCGSGEPWLQQVRELLGRIDKARPAPDDLRDLRAMLAAHPDVCRLVGGLARAAAVNIVNHLEADPLISESLKAAWSALQDQLGYAGAPALERLVIEQVALCWLQLHIVQLEYTVIMSNPLSASDVHSWERRLSAAQRRYLGACESLSRIRKLAAATPALQVAIAAGGGQQLNVWSGDPPGENALTG